MPLAEALAAYLLLNRGFTLLEDKTWLHGRDATPQEAAAIILLADNFGYGGLRVKPWPKRNPNR